MSGTITAPDAERNTSCVPVSFSAASPNGIAWSTTTPAGLSQNNWVYLWHGGRYETFLANLTTGVEYGLYTFAAGSSWYDPYHGVALQPNYNSYAAGQSPYDPQTTLYGSKWLGSHVNALAVGAVIGLGIVAGIATGGLATVGLAALGVAGMASGLLVGAAAGAAGGFAAGAAGSFGQGGSTSQMLSQGGIGAAAGAAGGVAGALVGAAAGSLTSYAGLTCANGLGGVGNFINGAAAGGAFGLTEGAIRGGINNGWNGAISQGLQGLAVGGVLGGTIGTLLGNACFPAGTDLFVPLTPEGGRGWQSIETFKKGTLVWTRDQHNPNGPLVIAYVDEIFVSRAKIVVLLLGSRVVRTTSMHGVYIHGKGWIPVAQIEPGDLTSSDDGVMTPVTEIRETGEMEDVYTLRVATHATFFVGGPDWGFSVWVHNECMPAKGTPEGDAARFERYQEGGGTLEYDDWYSHSRGGRDGGPEHAAIQAELADRPNFETEVQFGDRFADAAGPGEIHQIGELNERGDPIARERDAINDILASEKYDGEDIYFWDKNNPTASPIKNPHLQESWGARL